MHHQDVDLINRVLDGDERSFDAFYNLYFPRLYRFCMLRVANEDVVEEIVQQCFISAMRGLEGYKGEASLYTWLCQIGRNELSNWFRKNGTRAEKEVSIDQQPDLRSAVESLECDFFGPNEELNGLVQICFDHLPSSYSQSLQLKYIDGYSVAEIANQMSTTEVAIQSLLSRARQAFKKVYLDLHNEMQYGASSGVNA